MTKPKMLIVGFGRMGQRFTDIFSDGVDICISSTRNVSSQVEDMGATLVTDFETAVSTSDYIFIAVPIHGLDSVIQRINEYVPPHTWAFDVCSARISAAKKMSVLKCKWSWHLVI